MSTGNLQLAHHALEALHTLHTHQDTPNPDLTGDELDTLTRWPGWGPLAPAFDPNPTGSWQDVADTIDTLLDPDTQFAARSIVDTAFYTPTWLIGHMWRLLETTGITSQGSGTILDLGCGSGRFIHHRPHPFHRFHLHGVELDPTSARIATLTNPDATIVNKALQDVALPADVDAVIGNIPFGSGYVYDKAGINATSLHGYFITRALTAVRAGGHVMLLTSRHTLDTNWLTHIQAVADEAARDVDNTSRDTVPPFDVQALIRLPNDTFAADGTHAGVDLLVLRRCDPDQQVRRWVVDPHTSVSFLTEHPELVVGEATLGGRFGNDTILTHPDTRAGVEAAFNTAADLIDPASLTATVTGPIDPDEAAHEMLHPEGGFLFAPDGTLLQTVDATPTPVKRPTRELRDLVAMKMVAVDLIRRESDWNTPDTDLDDTRTRLRGMWDDYVARYGPLNRGYLQEGAVNPDTGQPKTVWKRPTMGGFRRDPESDLLFAVEHYDRDTGTGSPAPILLRRVNCRPEQVDRADTPREAIAVCLSEQGRIDLDRVAQLLNIHPSRVGDTVAGAVFTDPDTGMLVESSEYLSGHVAHKLDRARAAAVTDQRWQPNVDALERVLPKRATPADVEVRLGSPLVEPDDVAQFVQELFTLRHTPTVTRCTDQWSWQVSSVYGEVAATWGLPEYPVDRILTDGLNGRAPVVRVERYDSLRGEYRKVVSVELTTAAQDKLQQLNERFSLWVWEDAERAARICARFDDLFGSWVARTFTGDSVRLDLLGCARAPWKHQRAAIERITCTPRTLVAHPVGAGKTLEMVGAAMLLHRRGIVNKPMIAVPKHLLDQISVEARQVFPGGRFLTVSTDMLTGRGRRSFAARCATGDWDAVIVTHEVMTSFPLDPSFEERMLMRLRMRHEQALRDEDGSHLGSKDIARAIRTLDQRLRVLRDRKHEDGTIWFDHLGVDMLLVDEVHLFKSLPLTGRRQDLAGGTSKRALDLQLKIEWLGERAGSRPHAALFTGTPWTNSLVETFVWQTLVQPDRLRSAGLDSVDKWAAMFVQTNPRVELSPDGGGFRLQARPQIVNAGRLRTMLGENTDMLSSDELGLRRPRVERDVVVCDPSPEQSRFAETLVRRAERVHAGNPGVTRTGKQDNMLTVCGDGRMSALDPLLVGLDGGASKLDAVAERVARIDADTDRWVFPGSDRTGALQVVFCDTGTPKGDDDAVYGRLRDRMVAGGVNASMIRFVHEANTHQQKADLFAACRDGRVRVLIGSTGKLGLGTNIQHRLVAIHHVDAPWRPSDVEQREGRGVRPGNCNDRVLTVRYVTRRSLDAFVWQTLERKAMFVQQMVRGDENMQVIEDIGEVVVDYGQIKAAATDNPLVEELARQRVELRRLRMLESVDRQQVTAARGRIESLGDQLVRLRQKRDAVGKVCERRRDGAVLDMSQVSWLVDVGLRRKGEGRIRSRRVGVADGLWVSLGDDPYGSSRKVAVRLFGSMWDGPVHEVVVASTGGVEVVTGRVVDTIRAWWDGVDELCAGLDARIVEVVEDSAEAQRFVESHVFESVGELRQVQARVDALRMQVEAQVAASEDVAGDVMV